MLHKIGARVASIGDSTEPLAIQPAPRLAGHGLCASSVMPVTEFVRRFAHA